MTREISPHIIKGAVFIVLTVFMLLVLKNMVFVDKQQKLGELIVSNADTSASINEYRALISREDELRSRLKELESGSRQSMLRKADLPVIIGKLMGQGHPGLIISYIRPGDEQMFKGYVRKSIAIACEGQPDKLMGFYTEAGNQVPASYYEQIAVNRIGPDLYTSTVMMTCYLLEN